MCGIIGYASSEGISKGWTDRRDYLKDGLFVDAVRGMHSTGLMCVPKAKPGEVIIHKKAMNSSDFLDLATTDKLLNDCDKYQFMIGHNRHATKGGIKSCMAHPFNHGKITLVHNGTLFTQSYLPDGLKFDSDSEAITNALNVKPSSEIIPLLDGAFALVWHDASDDTLHLVRNADRPLTFAKAKNQDTLLIASEAKMLDWLASRNNIEIETIYEPGPGHELIFKNSDFGHYTSKHHELRKKKTYAANSTNYSGYGHYGGTGYKDISDIKAGANGRNKFKSSGKVVLSLQELGLARGTREDVILDNYVEYAGQHYTEDTQLGILECSLPDVGSNHTVNIHGQLKKDWGQHVGTLITAVIQSAYIEEENKKSGEITIIATDPLIFEEEGEEGKKKS